MGGENKASADEGGPQTKSKSTDSQSSPPAKSETSAPKRSSSSDSLTKRKPEQSKWSEADMLEFFKECNPSMTAADETKYGDIFLELAFNGSSFRTFGENELVQRGIKLGHYRTVLQEMQLLGVDKKMKTDSVAPVAHPVTAGSCCNFRGELQHADIDLRSSLVVLRKDLADKVIRRARAFNIVLIKSPPQSGKSSLCTVLAKRLSENGIRYRRHHSGDWERDEDSIIEWISCEEEERFLFLDDAQATYPKPGEETGRFWNKLKALDGTISKVRVVLFAAYYAEAVTGSTPPEFTSKNSFGFETLRYTREELVELLGKFNLWSQRYFKTTAVPPENFEALYLWTGGHPGVVYNILQYISSHSSVSEPWKPEFFQNELESDMILDKIKTSRVFLGMKDSIVQHEPTFRCIFDAVVDVGLVVYHSEEIQKKLVRFGVLAHVKQQKAGDSELEQQQNAQELDLQEPRERALEWQRDGEYELQFPGNFVRAVWLRFIYDNFAKQCAQQFTCLNDLVVLVLQSIPTRQLSATFSRGKNDVLYARFWQMMFFAGVCKLLPKGFISPDVGPCFGAQGFLDFYINSQHQIGVELLRDGKRLEEHIGRFGENGRYKSITLKEFAIIDFRRDSATAVSEDLKKFFDKGLWLVVYSSDYVKFRLYSKHFPSGSNEFHFKPPS